MVIQSLPCHTVQRHNRIANAYRHLVLHTVCPIKLLGLNEIHVGFRYPEHFTHTHSSTHVHTSANISIQAIKPVRHSEEQERASKMQVDSRCALCMCSNGFDLSEMEMKRLQLTYTRTYTFPSDATKSGELSRNDNCLACPRLQPSFVGPPALRQAPIYIVRCSYSQIE